MSDSSSSVVALDTDQLQTIRTEVQTSENRQRAHQALTRGRRSAPTADAKLKSWGQCEGQSALFSRQDLRTDQGQD